MIKAGFLPKISWQPGCQIYRYDPTLEWAVVCVEIGSASELAQAEVNAIKSSNEKIYSEKIQNGNTSPPPFRYFVLTNARSSFCFLTT